MQDLSLNPVKLAGQCGKLKCCLNYELATYIDAIRSFPPTDKPLETAEGTYYFFKYDIFKRLMWYSTQKDSPSNIVAVDADHVAEIIRMNAKARSPTTLAATQQTVANDEESFSSVVELDDDLTRFDSKNKRNGRGGRDNRNRNQPNGRGNNRGGDRNNRGDRRDNRNRNTQPSDDVSAQEQQPQQQAERTSDSQQQERSQQSGRPQGERQQRQDQQNRGDRGGRNNGNRGGQNRQGDRGNAARRAEPPGRTQLRPSRQQGRRPQQQWTSRQCAERQQTGAATSTPTK